MNPSGSFPEYVLACCQLFIAIVFLCSVTSKVRTRSRYTEFVSATRDLAPSLPAKVVAPAVILGEATTVILVAIPAAAAGFILAIGLLAAFTTAIIMAVRREQQVHCHCFGASRTAVGPAHIIRNLVLSLGSIAGLAAALNPPGSTPTLDGITVAVIIGATMAGIVLLTDDIAAAFTSTT